MLLKKIEHDLLAVGSSLTLTAPIGDDLRAAGSIVSLGSTIAGDAMVFGGVLNFSEASTIAGDAFLAGGLLNFAGKVNGDTKIFADEINFFGEILGDAEIHLGQKINFLEGAKISGTLTYFSENEIEIPEGIATTIEWRNSSILENHTKFYDFDFVGKIFTLLLGFVAGTFLLAVFGRSSFTFAEKLREKFWWSLLVGVLAFFAPVAIILLLVSFVGAWLGAILLAWWVVGLLVAGALIGFAVGSLIFRQNEKTTFRKKILTLAIGWLVFLAIGLIPGFGTIFQFTIFILVLGAGVLTDLEFYKKLKKAKLL